MKTFCLALMLLALPSLPAGAAVFDVTKTADTLDGACDHDCSLREAVTAANAAAGADFIVLGPGVYTLTRQGTFEDESATGDLDVLGPLTILGAGAGRTILDGAGIDRVLHATGQPGTLEIHGVTVRNGRARHSTGFDSGGGGGIFAGDKLILVDSVVSGNRAEDSGGGIWAFDLTARGATISGNEAGRGGGFHAVIIHLSNATLSGNRASVGGGIFFLPLSDDRSSIVHTTVTGNAATAEGGGLYVSNDIGCPADGSICPIPDYVRIGSSLLAGNTAPVKPDCANLENEGGYNVFGIGDPSCMTGPTDRVGTAASPLAPRLGPLADNGGPTPTHALLPDSPALDLASSCSPTDQRGRPRPANGCDAGAFEFSPGCQPSDEALCLGNRFRASVRWTAQGDSGAGRPVPLTADTGAFWFFEPDNLEMEIKVLNGCGLNQRYWVFLSGLTDVAVEVTVEDSLTGQTWTHHHAGGSPLPTLLDTSALAVCGTGGGGDNLMPDTLAGSVFRVTRTADTFDLVCDEDCSLRDAVYHANLRAGTEAIVLGPGIYTLSRDGRDENGSIVGDLDVAGDLVILGAGAEATILDGGGIDRVLEVHRSGNLEIHDVTIRNGRAVSGTDFGSGGGIRADGPATVVRCLIKGNQADWYGGGIFDLGRLTVRDSTVSNNTADSGGGIFDLRVTNENPTPKLRLTNVTVSGNRARYIGGISVDHVDTEISHLTVTGNHATRSWGGLLRNQCECIPEDPGCCGPLSHFDLSRSLIAGNTAGVAPDCQVQQNSGGFNVFGIGSFCHPGPTDRAGTLEAPLDPQLSPLDDHGGPTPTHFPLPGSPAIDFVSEACAGRDQRGVPRPANLCDAGSVEATPGCLPGPTRLCLQDGRFSVTVRWTAQGSSGPGRTVPLTADTGAFWFFDAANLELTVKVLDGCNLGGHYWVFLSGLTDVGVQVTVTDTATGNTWVHNHAAGTPLQPRLDTNALICVEP